MKSEDFSLALAMDGMGPLCCHGKARGGVGWQAGLCTQKAGSWEFSSVSRRVGFLSVGGYGGRGAGLQRLWGRDGQEKQLKGSLSLWARRVAQDH